MTDLKNRFDLSRDVPLAQDRLAWELPRFLEMASKRGRIIIVIDGLHRLVSSDEGTEAALNWLPLTLPPNVRVVLSATIVGAEKYLSGVKQDESTTNRDLNSDGHTDPNSENKIKNDDLRNNDEKRPRIIIEMGRRNWIHTFVNPLNKTLCKTVIDSYIRKSVQSDTSYLTTGSFLTAVQSDTNTVGTVGFLLFPSQIASILSHPESSKPIFLRLILRSLHWGASRGYCIWTLMESWLKAQQVNDLIFLILLIQIVLIPRLL